MFGALAGALVLVGPSLVMAADEVKPASAQPTLDELLEIGGKPAGGAAAKPADGAASTGEAPKVELDAQARKALEKEEQQAADALRKAVGEMYQVSERIGRDTDTSRDVQRDQEEIIKKLDQVIETAEKCQSQGGGSSSSGKPKDKKQNGSQKNQQQAKKPGQQQQQQASASAGGTTAGKGNVSGGLGITTPLAELRERWGNLPGRVREQLMQGVQEKVSPVYREWTEQYYKRLAEEQQ
jgi:hypothetical protein